MSDVIFEITEDLLESGLRGFPVGYCTTSDVDPLKGLSYSGIPIAELAEKDPYEVIYLLYYGKSGSSAELKKFSDDLKKRAICRPEVVQHIRELPREGHPMKLFSSAILILGMLEGKGNYREDCLNLIAKIPEVAAAVINYHAGWGKGNPSNPSLGYMENFAQMLNVPGGQSAGLTETFRLFNVLHYDHGGGNLSTFVGKAVASGLEDMYGSICAAMCALAGPRHGKANQDCLEFVEQVLSEVGQNATAADVSKLIRKKLANNELVFGFGHAVLRVEDARATVLYKIAQNKFADHPLVKIAKLLRSEGPKILAENPKISNPYPNVDAISGTVLAAAGFKYPEYFTVLFGMARTVGIAMQIVYERQEARDGKGLPLVRPDYIYQERGKKKEEKKA